MQQISVVARSSYDFSRQVIMAARLQSISTVQQQHRRLRAGMGRIEMFNADCVTAAGEA
jgi:hypothetical protein